MVNSAIGDHGNEKGLCLYPSSYVHPPPPPARSLVLYELLCLEQGCGLGRARPGQARPDKKKKKSKPLLLTTVSSLFGARPHISLTSNLPLRQELVHKTAITGDFHEINPVFGYTDSLRMSRTFEIDVGGAASQTPVDLN